MRLVTFQASAKERLGALHGDRVLDLQAAHVYFLEQEAGRLTEGERLLAQAQVPTNAIAFLELGEEALKRGQSLLQRADALSNVATGNGGPVWYSLDDVRLLAPLSKPEKLICVGLNYIDHAMETNMPVPKNPVLFSKFNTAIIGPGEAVIHPGEDVTTKLDYEAELVVVIGRRGKNISKEEAMDYVYGYTAMNDVSARDLQMEDGQWLKGKTLDTFAPIGPAIVTKDEVADPHALRISLTLNGMVMQDSSTKNLIFKVPDLISYLSRLMTLNPGDLIATGTPPGVGMARKPEVYMHPGDTATVKIEGVGELTNPVASSDRQ